MKEAEAIAGKLTDDKEKRRASNYVKIMKKVRGQFLQKVS